MPRLASAAHAYLPLTAAIDGGLVNHGVCSVGIKAALSASSSVETCVTKFRQFFWFCESWPTSVRIFSFVTGIRNDKERGKKAKEGRRDLGGRGDAVVAVLSKIGKPCALKE